MSGQTTGWVLRHGPKDRAMRAVLITIADAANRDGEHAHPGVQAMVEGSLYGRAHVLATVRKLVAQGWVEVEEEGLGRGHSTIYRVRTDRPQNVQRLDPSDEENVQPLDPSCTEKGPIQTPKRSNPDAEKVQSSLPSPISTTVNNGKTQRIAPSPPASRAVDEVWDALMSACQVNTAEVTNGKRGGYNRAVADLRGVGATPAEIHRRAAVYRRRWTVPLTPIALANHWAELGRASPALSTPRSTVDAFFANRGGP